MKILLILLTVLALSSLACADPTADSLSVSSASGDPGDTNVLVLMNITNVLDGPIQVIKLDIIYDSSVIELVDARRGPTLPTDEYGDPGWIVKLGRNKKSITIAANNRDHSLPNGTTGNIVKLYFDVNGTTGQTSSINVSNMDVARAVDYAHGTIPTINGTFTISGGIPGDLNGDGVVTSADAAIVLQMAVSGEYDAMADVNGEDSVSALDALMVMQIAADHITT